MLYILAALTTVAALSAPLSAQFNSVRVKIIDRGQADGILIRTPNEEWVVIDAGTNQQQSDAMDDVWGVDEVALAIVSHRHCDHHGGMDNIIRDFAVRQLVMNVADCPDRSSDDAVRSAAAEHNVPIQSVGADTITVDGVDFIIIPTDPVDDECPEEENNNSILIRMQFGEFSMLFTGDAETEQREWLMENHPDLLDATVLKASHHGSRNGVDGVSDGQSWMSIVDPQDVIISVHPDSQFGHPHPEAMGEYEATVGDRGFCTSRHGTVTIFGRSNGSRTITRQFPSNDSCRFTGS